ncbi:hypothetical protein [Flammeovirga agarivorans]|uniref:Uncharacterized protein n=1 Tax=Flammeovirga agarivorans TaxID=2726742 RepID=A0A7X8SRH8_9BACT|nr:hypothetical protein [Flammeovirga agarivorans]NLR95081.1 hypothetical protein [Flammeovirga agarivorans]
MMLSLYKSRIKQIKSSILKRDIKTAKKNLYYLPFSLSEIEIKNFEKSVFVIIRGSFGRTISDLNIERLKMFFEDSEGVKYFFDKVQYFRFYYKLLLEKEEFDEIERTMSGALDCYDPELYYLYGLYNIRIGKIQKARKYIFLSGIEKKETISYNMAYFDQLKNGHGNQIVGKSNIPFVRKIYRNKIPLQLKEKLKMLNAPEWLTRD